MNLLKLYNLYKALAPAVAAVAGAVLTVQSALGVNHSTIAGTIATAILSLVGAFAVSAAHSDTVGVNRDDMSQNPPS